MDRERARRRFLWSLLASVALNSFWLIFPVFSMHGASREPKVVALVMHFEHRKVPPPPARTPLPKLESKPKPLPTPQPVVVRTPPPSTPAPQKRVAAAIPIAHHFRRHHHPRDKLGKPEPPPPMEFTPNGDAAIALPSKWSSQDFKGSSSGDTALYTDLKGARGAFVPRVLLLHLNTAFLSGPSLQDAVHDVVANLRSNGASVSASKAQPVCGGKLVGWYIAYRTPSDDQPAQFENILVMSGDTVLRAIYSRPVGEAEDPRMRAGLNTLCPN